METDFTNRDIVAIDDFSRDELVEIIEEAKRMQRKEERGERYSKELKGKKLFNMFYESSTRTINRFITGMFELGGFSQGFAGIEGTSVKKKESLIMTDMMAQANHPDVIVIRHPKDGSAQWVADVADIPVFNGGDGKNEHPTQTMLDIYSIDQIIPGVNGGSIGLGGDLRYGRTAHSLPIGLSKFEDIILNMAAPPELSMPHHLIDELQGRGVKIIIHDSLEDAIRSSQVFYMTRPQKERMIEDGITEKEADEMLRKYLITIEAVKANPKLKILHPLPIDSHLGEIDFSLIVTENAYFLKQAENGIFMSKALLYLVLKSARQKRFKDLAGRIKLITPNNRYTAEPGKRSNKGSMYMDSIANGTVIDHIEPGKAQEIANRLKLDQRSGSVLIAHNLPSPRYGGKDVIKLVGQDLSEKDLKQILMLSPNATFSRIKDHNIAKKFNAIICENTNCITRDIYEDVPPKFEKGETLRCHYCRTPHTLDIKGKPKQYVTLPNVSSLELALSEIKGDLEILIEQHILTGDDYERLKGNGIRKGNQAQNYYQERAYKLAVLLNEYVLNSLFSINDDPKKRTDPSELLAYVSRRLELCGLNNHGAGSLVKNTVQFAESEIFTREKGLLAYKPGVKERQKEIVEKYISDLKPTDYIVSNAIRAIDLVSPEKK